MREEKLFKIEDLGINYEEIQKNVNHLLNGGHFMSSILYQKSVQFDEKNVSLYVNYNVETTREIQGNKSIVTETFTYTVHTYCGDMEYTEEFRFDGATKADFYAVLKRALENVLAEPYVKEYPMGRDWELKDNLMELCYSEMMEAWWRGEGWEGDFFIADTLGGTYSVTVEYRTDNSLLATVTDGCDNDIDYESFDIDCEGAAFAFEEMCKWVDGQLTEISKKH